MKNHKFFIGGALLCLVILLIWTFQQKSDESNSKQEGLSDENSVNNAVGKNSSSDQAANDKRLRTKAEYDERIKCLKELKSLTAQLKNAKTQEEKNAIIKKIDELIKSARGSKAAAAAFAEFIGQGLDAETGLSFEVAEMGKALETAPSVRLMVLDGIMESDPTIGLQVSREVMDRLTSADEYAISLKNMVAYDQKLENREESEERFATLMAQKDWLENPSSGLYHSFDFAVEFSSKNAFETLSKVLMENDETKYGNAFRLAADRIMLRNQEVVIDKYFENPKNFLKYSGESEEYTRSVVLSRVDITKPSGVDLFVTYLNSFSEKNKELDNFIGFFPNAIHFLGNRLVSDEENWAVSSIVYKDADVLKMVNKLLSEDKIPHEYGGEIIKNLERYISKNEDQK